MTEIELFTSIFKCSILGQPLNAIDIDMQRLWDFAGLHSIRALIAHNLLESKYDMSKEWTENWKEEKYKNLRKTLFFKTEREKIYQKLDDAKIWHIPIKGIILDNLYPKFGTREFSDNDIWIAPNSFGKLKAIMDDMGYHEFASSSNVHYSFHKEPFWNFEFHYRLFSDLDKFKSFNDYFDNLLSEIIKPDSGTYFYELSDEASYIYILAHAYKHYNESGFGLRTVADVWLFRQKNLMNRRLLTNQLEALGIKDFSDTLEGIGDKLFGDEKDFSLSCLSDREFAMFDNIIKSGKFGNNEMYYIRGFQQFTESRGKKSMIRYLFYRLFPDIELYKNRNSFLYRHKILHPVFYVYRGIHGIVINGKHLRKEIKTITEYKSSDNKNNKQT